MLLDYPLKDKMICVDYSRRKVKFKDKDGNIDKERKFVDNQEFGTTNSGDLYPISNEDVGY